MSPNHFGFVSLITVKNRQLSIVPLNFDCCLAVNGKFDFSRAFDSESVKSLGCCIYHAYNFRMLTTVDLVEHENIL